MFAPLTSCRMQSTDTVERRAPTESVQFDIFSDLSFINGVSQFTDSDVGDLGIKVVKKGQKKH